MADLWAMTVKIGDQVLEARWDEELGLVAPQEVYEPLLDLEAMGVQVGAEPTGPWWTAGWRDPDQAFFTVERAVDEVVAVVGGPPGWPWGVPEGATDR